LINHKIINLKFKLFLLILFIGGVLSQTEQEPFATEKEGKVYYIQAVSDAPSIDGVLDDAIWSSILPITDFIQEEPDNMAEPTENTEVYITYDDQALYVAARMYDSEPSEIVRQLAPRDDWYGAFDEQADWLSIELDSRHDHQTAFSFAVNASGVLSDEMIYNDEDYDTDWNAIWEAEAIITDFGWVVEMEIPFSNLPFFSGDELTWGLNITRFIQRKYETVTWVAFPLDVEGVVSKYGHLHGLQGIYPPDKFEFKPYSMAGVTNYSDIRLADYENPTSWKTNYKPISSYNLGLDIQYRINTNSKLTFALNPDFGQVESDPADVNLTAYETYFSEKRPFFMADIDIFETPIEIFYSRRIGEKAWGQGMTIYESTDRQDNDTLYYDVPEIIKSAGKLTGKTQSGLSYGLLGAVATLDDSSRWANLMTKGKNRYYFVTRIKQDLFAGNSFVGLMTTSSLADSAYTFSMDGRTNLLDNQLGIDGQIIMTSEEHKGIYGNISYYPSGFFSGWIDYYYYDKDIDLNDLGYLWRDDYTQTKLGLKFQTMEPWNIIRNASIMLEGDMEKNTGGLDFGKTIELNYDIQFDNFWDVGGGLYKIMEHYDDRKILLDYEQNEFGPPIFIPEVVGAHFNISSDKHRKLWCLLSFTWASNTRYDTERGQYVELTYKPSSHLSFSTSYDSYSLIKQYHWLESFYEDKDSKYHHIFSDIHRSIDVLTFRTTGNISRKLSVQGYLEIYSNHDMYDKNSYSEYLTHQDLCVYCDSTAYMLGGPGWKSENNEPMPVYTQDIDKLDLSYLDPNLYNGLYPKFTSMVFNGIIKWNYTKGSNIYFVYSSNKSVNGTPFHGIDGLSDFLQFNSKKSWVEILRDQSIMVKIDYWFEK